MDISELLCVGRSRKSRFETEKTNQTLARAGLSFEGTLSNSDHLDLEFKSATEDKHEGYNMIASRSNRSLTPPSKKSILRGRPVSPRFGSPTSSVRNVRFSDKDGEDEAMFAHLHVNETTQTDTGKTGKRHKTDNHDKSRPVICGKSKFEEDLNLSDAQEIKTSTPRTSKNMGTPSYDYLSPRHFDVRQNKMLSTSPKASEQKQHKDKLVIDIDITPRKAGKQTPETLKRDQQKEMGVTKPDGKKIIQNFYEKPYVPDGRKITQNMEFGHTRNNSTGTQTLSECSSPRSISPETPSRNMFSDGSIIIRNMELGSIDPRIRMKSEAVQTVNMDDIEPPFKSKGIQTPDELSAPENDKCRSISMQTDLDTSEIFEESDEEVEDFRSISTQTQDINQDVPDAARITQNMAVNKHQHVKRPDSSKVAKLDSCTVTKLPSSSLNENDWNDFVRRLEKFEPSPSHTEESDSEDEFIENTKNEPVIVYDSHPRISPAKVDDISAVQHRESMGARKFLESEEFTRQQYESVLQEESFFQKLKPVSKAQTHKEPVIRTSTQINHATEKPTKAQTHYASPSKVPVQHYAEPVSAQPVHKPISIPNRSKSGIQTFVHGDNKLQSENGLTATDVFQNRPRRASLTFTPIETYSFKAESLNKDTSTLDTLSVKKATPVSMGSPKHAILNDFNLTESNMKNAYIQGLDLGPIPNTPRRDYDMKSYDKKSYTTDYIPSSYSTTNTLPTKRYMQPTLSSQAAGRSYCFTPANGGSSYTMPVGKSAVGLTSSFSSRNSCSPRSRPSSAPSSRSGGHQLSSSLKEMRNTAVRKSAMSSVLDPKRKSSYDYGSSKHYITSRSSYGSTKSSSHRFGSPYKSYDDYDLYTYSGSRSRSPNKPSSYGTTSSFSKRNTSPITPRQYMNALNDVSNARLDRSRSRSRSPNCDSVRRSYDSYTYSSAPLHSKAPITNARDEDTYARKVEKDDGYITSVTTNRAHAHTHAPVNSNIVAEKMERQSRTLTRKPPLPTKSSRSRERDSSKEGRKFSRSPSTGRSGSRRNDEPVKYQPPVTDNTKSVHEKTLSKSTTQRTSSRNNSRDRLQVSNTGTITIGSVPQSVIDKTALYLGHDTIQRIINEAKL